MRTTSKMFFGQMGKAIPKLSSNISFYPKLCIVGLKFLSTFASIIFELKRMCGRVVRAPSFGSQGCIGDQPLKERSFLNLNRASLHIALHNCHMSEIYC